MFILRVTAPVLLAALASACATNSYNSDPYSSIRQKARIEAAGFAEIGQIYFAKNGAEALERAAVERVRDSMKDPDSAKFRNVAVHDYRDGKVVCGEVNAKNSYGGYVGFTKFIASDSRYFLKETGSTKDRRYQAALNAGIDAACP